jgi:hypothetical protein
MFVTAKLEAVKGPSARWCRGERLVLLIDGLDEYAPRPGSPPGDPLARFLPYALPPSVLYASRPCYPYVDSLATRRVPVQIALDNAQSFADNAATVRAFLEKTACESGLDAAFVAQVVERADGNLEHAAMLHHQSAGLPARGSGSRPIRRSWTGWASCALLASHS